MQQRLSQSVSHSDDTPLARCYALHAIPLLAYIRQYVPSREDAEDLVVEVFIAALEHKGASIFALSEREQLGWLRRVAYYKCVDRYRRLAHQSTVPLEDHVQNLFEEERLGPEQVTLRHEEQAWLRQGLSQLPEHYQTILRLRFANGLRCSEIGRLLKKSDGAIRVALSRALNTLREISRKQSEEQNDE
ncbi:MAG TPA: sigma-70 family RNA polymerase sigma factor [Ktedonobacteraceae bacterium]|nr:sigma-70 family RNA polymerase sigma factor [Ktedonobacteraceae bacterium]